MQTNDLLYTVFKGFFYSQSVETVPGLVFTWIEFHIIRQEHITPQFIKRRYGFKCFLELNFFFSISLARSLIINWNFKTSQIDKIFGFDKKYTKNKTNSRRSRLFLKQKKK